LGYRTPDEFAAANGCGKDGGSATLENAPRFPVSHSPGDGPVLTLAVEPKAPAVAL